MYIYQPKRENKAYIVLPLLLIAVFAVAIIGSNLKITPYPAILQFIAIVSVALAIQIITRYSLTTFTYEANEETRIFYVRRLAGKKAALVAALDYDDIISVDKREKGYSVKKKYNKSFKQHNFCLNIMPRDSYCLVCDVEGMDIAVVIEADDRLLQLLNDRKKREE